MWRLSRCDIVSCGKSIPWLWGIDFLYIADLQVVVRRAIYEIFCPNGARASSAILKCCKPRGMPTIVRQRIAPRLMCARQISIPPNTIQMTFMIIDRHPMSLVSHVTFLPKGQRENPAILINCTPNGMPMIVRQNTRPMIAYQRLMRNPPQIIQMRFPNIVILAV